MLCFFVKLYVNCFLYNLVSCSSIIVVHYDGRVEERKVLRDAYSGKEKFNVLITDFDMVMRDRAYLKKVQWQYMFVDEGHRLITYESFARAVNSG